MKSLYLKTGLRGQLVLLFLLVSLAPLLLFSFLVHRDGKIALKNTIAESLVRFAKGKLNHAHLSIQSRVENIKNHMPAISEKVAQANGDALSKPSRLSTLRRVNSTLQNSITQFEGHAGSDSEITITNLHRQIVISTAEKPSGRPINDEWWHKAYNNGFGYDYIEDLQFDEVEKRHILTVALPIRRSENPSSEIVGVLRANITIPVLSEMVKSSSEADKIFEGIETFIIRNG